MAKPAPSRVWLLARRLFRWFRIAVLLLILAALVLLVWLNQVGLPEFLKTHLLIELRAQGVEMQFTRMRFRWYRGVVAENITFGRPGQRNGPRLTATEGELQLNHDALKRLEVQVDGVALRGGVLNFPVWGTNGPAREVTVDGIRGELRFLPRDQWELSSFEAQSFGLKLSLAGTITNATAFRKWKFGADKPPSAKSAQAFWHELVGQLQKVQMTAPAEAIGRVTGDARDPKSFHADLHFSAPAFASPWGTGTNLSLTVEVKPQPDEMLRANLRLKAEDARTPWGEAQSVRLATQIAPSFTRAAPTNAAVVLELVEPRSPWAQAAHLLVNARFAPHATNAAQAVGHYEITARSLHAAGFHATNAHIVADTVQVASNLWPNEVTAQLRLAQAGLRTTNGTNVITGDAGAVVLQTSFTLPSADELALTNRAVAWRTRLDKIPLAANAQLTEVHAASLTLPKVSFAAHWRAPQLHLETLHAGLFGGQLNATARLDVVTRELVAAVTSDLDAHRFDPLLGANSRRWLAQYTWEQAPQVEGAARLTLPPWTNWNVNWGQEVVPTLSLRGQFKAGAAAYRGVPVNSAESEVMFTNQVWHLPALKATRPEGELLLEHIANDDTREYYFRFNSSIDLQAVRPLLADDEQRRVFDLFAFTTPPHVEGEVRGRWRRPEETGVRGRVAASNFTFRGESLSAFASTLEYTNQVLNFTNARVLRAEGEATVPFGVADFQRKIIALTNVTSTLEVSAVTRAIGKKVARTMEPYQFSTPPTVSVTGVIDLDARSAREDMTFDVSGGPFQWKVFRLPVVTARIHWLGDTLTLTNVSGAFHEGQIAAHAHFDFARGEHDTFAFQVDATNVNLHSLMGDISSKTNKLEGALHGRLVVTNGVTEDLQSWFGYGDATLRDGLIWELPVFGMFSPMLNKVVPGLGSSRARQAAATFLITNSVIFSADLEVQTSGARMQFDGTVDFATRLNARAEAQLFRDLPGVGALLSKLFWPVTKLFEYKITGTLAQPKTDTLYIPKILMMPLHPFRTIKELFEDKHKTDELPK